MGTATLDYPTTPLGMLREAREYLLANGGTQQELARNAVLIAKYEGEKRTHAAETQRPEETRPLGGSGNGHSQAKAPSKFASQAQLDFIYSLLLQKGGIDVNADGQESARVWLANRTPREASEMIDKLKGQPNYVPEKTSETVRTPAAEPKQAFGADVHPGRYAVDGKVYRVTRGKLGTQWAGRTFAREIETDRQIRGAELAALLARIAADPMRYVKEYAALTGRCSNCGRVLTNKISIEEAMGPVCAGRFRASNESESEEVTTTANKHGLRAAAQKRTARHAQKTELPPRGAEESREDRIRSAQARKLEKRKAEDAAEAVAKEAAIDDSSKSGAKAIATRDYLAGHGWESAFCRAEDTDAGDDVIELTATRTDGDITEILWVSWTKGVLTTTPMPTYTLAERTIKLRNVAELKRYSVRSAAEARAEVDRVSANKAFKRKPLTPTPGRGKIPFDTEEATEAEILGALLGKTVSWHNRYRETQETARVGTNPRKVHFTEYGGERIFNFLCPATGYRAFRITALMKVAR